MKTFLYRRNPLRSFGKIENRVMNRHPCDGSHDPRVRFERVFDECFDTIHRFLSRRVGRELADELAAETFAEAYRVWARFDGTRAPLPWLYGIATNILRHHYRDEKRMLHAYYRTGIDPVLEDVESDRVQRLDASLESRRLARALADLRVEERDVLLLFAWGDLTYEDISDALSIPIGTVRSRLSRARAKVRNFLQASGQEQEESPPLKRTGK
jgi:RNA polymerase sigma factor (sigma-70 family)